MTVSVAPGSTGSGAAGTVVTVRGRFEAKYPPERATVLLTVGHDGGDKAQVHERTVATANGVAAAIRALVDPPDGPATWWSGDRIRTSSHRPWNKDGKQLPPVHRAAVGMRVKFRDFDALARFLDDVGVRPGVSVQGLDWALTEARRTELDRDARRRAVADALERARDYATAAGLTSVMPVAIADAGMLGDRSAAQGPDGPVAFARAAAAGGAADTGDALDLSPEDITVAATVDARFLAS